MAVFGSFTYGSSQVYGADGSAVTVTFIAQNLIRVDFLAELVVDDALYDASNYSITFADGSGSTDVNVREVVQFEDDRTTTQHVLLLTDRHTRGTAYELTVSDLRPRVGGVIATATSAARTNRRTKVDSMLQSLPSFYDRRPGSIVASIIGAIGLEDERIGGSGSERV